MIGAECLAQIEAKDGVLNALYKMRDEKLTRFVGVTCHNDPEVLKTALERHDFDCVQMALNAALQGMVSGREGMAMVLNSAFKTSFENLVLPVARSKNLGILAMKVMGQEMLVGTGDGKSHPEKLLRYSLSLPVATAVVGMPKLDLIKENTEYARNFQPMPVKEMQDFSRQVSAVHKMALDLHFHDHVDC